MTRTVGLVALASIMLAGCAQNADELPKMVHVELPELPQDYDADITQISLRPESTHIVPKLPRSIHQPDLSLRLRSEYARLQLQLPMLPRRLPLRLTAIARSYWEPEDIGEPRGKFLLRLHIPLASASTAGASAALLPVQSFDPMTVLDQTWESERDDVLSFSMIDQRKNYVITENDLNNDEIIGLSLLAPNAR